MKQLTISLINFTHLISIYTNSFFNNRLSSLSLLSNKHKMKFIIPIILLFTSCFISCENSTNSASDSSTTEIKKDSVAPKEPVYKYGFNVDSFDIIVDTVKANWTLSHMLLPYGINQVEINDAYNKSKDSLVGLKHISKGKPFTIFYPKGDSIKAQYCVYQKNKIEYIVYDFTDTINVYKKEKDVTIQRKMGSGIITSSLWNAFIDNGLSANLVMNFAQIYQWSIDFFSLKKGDSFKVIYDEKFVEGESVGYGDIHAVAFNHYDSTYYAIPFDNGESVCNYDYKGGSLKKALLKAPLEFTRVSSKFSYHRKHPVLGIVRPHLGVDYAAPRGTPVVTVGDGVITFAGWSGGAGRLIKIKHTNGIETMYMHLYKINVKKGQHVSQGQVIGQVGSTGLSTGPHLDYRIRINGKYVDPLSAKIPTSEPLKEELLPEFNLVRDSIVNMLNEVPMPEVKVAEPEVTDTTTAI